MHAHCAAKEHEPAQTGTSQAEPANAAGRAYETEPVVCQGRPKYDSSWNFHFGAPNRIQYKPNRPLWPFELRSLSGNAFRPCHTGLSPGAQHAQAELADLGKLAIRASIASSPSVSCKSGIAKIAPQAAVDGATAAITRSLSETHSIPVRFCLLTVARNAVKPLRPASPLHPGRRRQTYFAFIT